jgi:hypothetical protein
VRACVHMGEYSYVYEYLYLYCVSKKRMEWGNEKFLVQYHFFIFLYLSLEMGFYNAPLYTNVSIDMFFKCVSIGQVTEYPSLIYRTFLKSVSKNKDGILKLVSKDIRNWD